MMSDVLMICNRTSFYSRYNISKQNIVSTYMMQIYVAGNKFTTQHT